MWNDCSELVMTMEKSLKQANQYYVGVMNSADNSFGPTQTKVRLLNEMEDLRNFMSVS